LKARSGDFRGIGPVGSAGASRHGHGCSCSARPHEEIAVDTIRFAKRLPNDRITNRIAGQLTDSAGAVAAGYRAVCRARSRADFIYKLGNAIEEADESALWLEILTESEISTKAATDPLWKEADELVRILVRSRETARANQKSRTRK
jgi:four helix bundle protein